MNAFSAICKSKSSSFFISRMLSLAGNQTGVYRHTRYPPPRPARGAAAPAGRPLPAPTPATAPPRGAVLPAQPRRSAIRRSLGHPDAHLTGHRAAPRPGPLPASRAGPVPPPQRVRRRPAGLTLLVEVVEEERDALILLLLRKGSAVALHARVGAAPLGRSLPRGHGCHLARRTRPFRPEAFV